MPNTVQTAQSDAGSSRPPPEQRVEFAIVGLGALALGELLPALGVCRKARLAALVSGSPEKARTVARQYGVLGSHIYNYENYGQLRNDPGNDPGVDVIYITMPNGLHAEYAIRGAQSGKHILCKKPLATRSVDCHEMIAACKAAGRKLMTAYRCQYEPYNHTMIDLARSLKFGDIKSILAVSGGNISRTPQWQHNRVLVGGGALINIGIYCLNAARYITGEEPVEVLASVYSTPGDERFHEVEEQVDFILCFPSGVTATCQTSHGYYGSNRYRVSTSEGWFELDPAFAYRGLRMRVDHQVDETGMVEERGYPERNQFALEIDHMATCVLQNRVPHTPGGKDFRTSSSSRRSTAPPPKAGRSPCPSSPGAM